MTPKDFTVGQVVFLVDSTHRRSADKTPRPAKVAKLGRDWVYLDGRGQQTRFAPGEREDDGRFRVDYGDYTSALDVWLSVEDYENARDRAALWAEVSARVARNIVPANFTTDEMRALLAKLKGE